MTERDEWDEKAERIRLAGCRCVYELTGSIVSMGCGAYRTLSKLTTQCSDHSGVAAVLREQAEKHKAELAKSLVVIKQEAKRADDNFILTEQLRAQLAAAHDRAEWCNKLYDGRE